MDRSAEVFGRIWRVNLWGDAETRSGPGSTLVQTTRIRAALPDLLRRLGVEVLLDAPCGDFNWLRAVDLGDVEYVGVDVVPEIVEANRRAFGDRARFVLADLTDAPPLPRADLVICRELLGHFPFADALAALRAFRASGSARILTTTFPGHPRNREGSLGGFRPLNLRLPPFSFPEPEETVAENYPGKALGLWRLADLPL